MFNSEVFDKDNFDNLTVQQKWLYVSLCMRCDSDGICNSVNSVLKLADAKKEDLNALEQNGLILRDTESTAICVVDWHKHNLIGGDRYYETIELEFKDKIYITEYNKLTLEETPFNYAEVYFSGGALSNAVERYKEFLQKKENLEQEGIVPGEETEEDRKRKQELLDQAQDLED